MTTTPPDGAWKWKRCKPTRPEEPKSKPPRSARLARIDSCSRRLQRRQRDWRTGAPSCKRFNPMISPITVGYLSGDSMKLSGLCFGLVRMRRARRTLCREEPFGKRLQRGRRTADSCAADETSRRDVIYCRILLRVRGHRAMATQGREVVVDSFPLSPATPLPRR